MAQAWDRRLFFYIRRLVADEEDAWQVLQQVWLQVLRSIRTLRDPLRLPVWLYAITRNTLMDHRRDGYARGRVRDAAGSLKVSGEDHRMPLDDADLVHHGLSRIPWVDREVLTLFFLRDLSIDEVSEVLGIPPGTVKSRLFKAKKALREALEREGG